MHLRSGDAPGIDIEDCNIKGVAAVLKLECAHCAVDLLNGFKYVAYEESNLLLGITDFDMITEVGGNTTYVQSDDVVGTSSEIFKVAPLLHSLAFLHINSSTSGSTSL